MRILFAENEATLAKTLKFLLEKNKYTVDWVQNGKDALEFFHHAVYDAVILDNVLPNASGFEVLCQLRKEKSQVPILMITAKQKMQDRVAALENGADDCLSKPFATEEFIARVKALTRRNKDYYETVLKFGNVEFKCHCYELSCKEKTVRLNNKEYQMLELFFRHPHFIFSTEHLMQKIWGLDSKADIDVVWTYIGFIRKKLKAIDSDIEIRNMRGAGYSLEEK